MKRAFLTGITGQDGSYLAELLLAKNYEVHGLVRRSSSFNTGRIEHIFQDPHVPDRRLYLHYGDMVDAVGLERLLSEIQPDEIYHLAAQSHVRVSFDTPVYTADVVALGTVRLLEAMRRTCPSARFYQASSSEIFGNSPAPQNERTPLNPQSPYACAKAMAYHFVCSYRTAYRLFAANGILFNHESPRRGITFVTRKVTRGIARILAGRQDKIYLGNLDAKRDWGHARDFVEAIYLILQHDSPDDFVIATGESHSVREFVEEAFRQVGLDWRKYVQHDARYERPAEVFHLCGDAAKARQVLGWRPKVGFRELIREMLEEDLRSEGVSTDCLREK